jgi:hypothetical protein
MISASFAADEAERKGKGRRVEDNYLEGIAISS